MRHLVEIRHGLKDWGGKSPPSEHLKVSDFTLRVLLPLPLASKWPQKQLKETDPRDPAESVAEVL